MASNPDTKALFGIPRQLRDRIYEMVLLSENKAPKFPSDDNPSKHLPRSNAEGLLACNHQLRQEVVDVIALLSLRDSGLLLKMDVIVWQSKSQITWLSVPAPIQYIKQMTVTSRIPVNTEWISTGWELEEDIDLALEEETPTILSSLMCVLGHDPDFVFGPCPLHFEKVHFSVTLIPFKSKPGLANYFWPQGYTFDSLDGNKERSNAILCDVIEGYVEDESMFEMTDQFILRYDQIVTVWQRPKRQLSKCE